MLRNYYTTNLEDWVTKLYIKIQVFHPKHIKEEEIAQKLGIFLHRKPMPPSYQVLGRYRGITVDVRVSYEEQREMFFHELCHILRHAGTQDTMPSSFRDLQEWDAHNFVRYAAIPYHQLKYIDFNQPNIEQHMAELFGVSIDLAKERVHQFESRCKLNVY